MEPHCPLAISPIEQLSSCFSMMAKFWAAGEGLRLKRGLFWCWLSLFFIVPRAGCCELHRAALASSHTSSREVASLQIRTSFFSLLAAGAQLATYTEVCCGFFFGRKKLHHCSKHFCFVSREGGVLQGGDSFFHLYTSVFWAGR